MSLDILLALISFSFVSSITPGPNNIMLMTSGANFGLRRTLPHLMGVSIGFIVMVLLVGVGVMQIFTLFPVTYIILKVISIAYLLYLAYRIAVSASLTSKQSDSAKPLTFIQAALFQWVNPKAWTMALMAITLFAPTQELHLVAIIASVFGLVNIPCVSAWTILGRSMNKLLKNQRNLHIFNIVMAILLVASVVIVL
ncbi:MAG: LysE family translocator [Gammaproteobacteria bacterium]|jgi:threonine/homoserine/homoserine lactone efflux protein